MKKILYGVSGIGNGHANRQLPIIEELAKDNKILIFAYDDSFSVFQRSIRDKENVSLVKIAVPFVVGNESGLDFDSSATHPENREIDFTRINFEAMGKVVREFGKPDLVISDYEPVCAQLAYSYNCPLVTVDQQSKYLYADLPKTLGGFSFEDEIHRLHMFFPKADARIACSFFRTERRPGGDEVLFFPSPIKKSITGLVRRSSKRRSVLVYISSAREFVQPPREVVTVLASQPDTEFHLFIKSEEVDQYKSEFENIYLHRHGDSEFFKVFSFCHGIISTAGHSLLSEAMYLGVPVYAIPVAPYEQHMNAYVIAKNKFGVSSLKIEEKTLKKFLTGLAVFSSNIKNDQRILVRGEGGDLIVDYLKKKYLDRKKILLFSPPFDGHLNILKELVKDYSDQFDFHLVINGWKNIPPDLEGINPSDVTVLEDGDLGETDPALWTFLRVVNQLKASLDIADKYQPDLIIYDFFSLEGRFVGQLMNIPFWCSIPAMMGAFENREYRDRKFEQGVNRKALLKLGRTFGISVDREEVEIISDGFHLPGEINLVWSFPEITPDNYGVGRQSKPYVFVGNIRGDNRERANFYNRKPLIYISFGTVVMDNLWNQQPETRRRLTEIIDSLSKIWSKGKYQIIFVTQGKEILESYPDNWWVYDKVDQVEILSRADVFITHGGSNSFHEAIMQKVPMVIIPFFGDQLLVAEVARKAGFGESVGGSKSIDTRSAKDFLRPGLAIDIDASVSSLLHNKEVMSRYLHFSPARLRIDSLIRGEVSYRDGDLVVGGDGGVKSAPDQLPTSVEEYGNLLTNDVSNVQSPKLKNLLISLRDYLGGRDIKGCKEEIVRFISQLYRVHVVESGFHSHFLQETGVPQQSLIYYRKIKNTYVPVSRKEYPPGTSKLQSTNLPRRVYLTSENQLKLKALENALRKMSPANTIIIEGKDPGLKINEQLVGMDEVAHGVAERLRMVEEMLGKEFKTDDLIVSVVSGIVYNMNQWEDVALVMMRDGQGRINISRSVSLSFPLNAVQKASARGYEKHTVGSVLAEDVADHAFDADPHSLITMGKETRLNVLEEAVIKCYLGLH